MNMILSISAGAIAGALGRHYMMIAASRIFGNTFPWGTLIINILGSFLIGVVIEVFALKLNASQELRAFLTVGILGSFTTFSTFSLDTATLIQRGEILMASTYVVSSVLIGLASLFAGIYITRFFIGG